MLQNLWDSHGVGRGTAACVLVSVLVPMRNQVCHASCEVLGWRITIARYPCMRLIIAGFIFGHSYTLQKLREDKRTKRLERLTLDRAFHGQITAEPLPGANFPANRGRRRIPRPVWDKCGEYYVAHVCLQTLHGSNGQQT